MKNKFLIGTIVVLVIFNAITMKWSIEKKVNLMYNEDELTELLQEVHPANVLVDLRDREDYELGHIDGFINIPSNDGVELLEYLEKNKLERKAIFLMCYSGKRAAAAVDLLQERGYRYLTYITFGYNEYANSQENFVPAQGECDCLAD
jgi:rhodanese-related sulfurtransferase